MTAETMATPAEMDYQAPMLMKFVSDVPHGQFQDAESGQWHDNGRTYKTGTSCVCLKLICCVLRLT